MDNTAENKPATVFIKKPLSQHCNRFACLAVAAAVASPIGAIAQPDNRAGFSMEEVLVTAERREANLQEVPVAVSSFSQSDLRANQVFNLGDLQSLVPNLSVHVVDANNAVV